MKEKIELWAVAHNYDPHDGELVIVRAGNEIRLATYESKQDVWRDLNGNYFTGGDVFLRKLNV